MSSVYRPSTIDDEGQIIEFLKRVFSADCDAAFVQPSLLRWKYWEPRPDWSDPRSFVIEKGGRIVAHAGLWPVTVRTGTGTERGVHMIDWAADPQTPGAGVVLLQRLTQRYDFVYSIGGSDMTRAILLKFGFCVSTQALTFARPLRPWQQMLQHHSKDGRLPLRLARNFWWSRLPARVLAPGWVATEAGASDVGGTAALTADRDGSFFHYLQQCPSARFLGFHVMNQGRKSGFLALAVVGKQARLAGLWLENPTAECWRTAFHLAQDAALRYSATSELVVRTADEGGAAAAAQAGMRLRRQTPVFLLRKGDRGAALPLHFQMWDNDSAFMGNSGAEFLT